MRGLSQQGIRIELIDYADWAPGKLPAAKRELWFDNLNHPVDSNLALHFCMPQQVQAVKDKLNVNFTMFEADRIIKNWVKLNAQHDLVILPTESSQQAWMTSGFPAEKIRLCPLGVNTDMFHPDVEPMALKDQTEKSIQAYRVRFLNVSDLTPRKNLFALAKGWIMATHRYDDAVLILKLSSSEERLSEFMRNLEALESRLGKPRNDAAPIRFLVNRFFSDAEMPGLFAAATHYWSMSHGEGWDLPMMEAGATGLHVIAPNHSAYMAYLDDSVARMIPAKTTPVKFKMRDGTHKLFRGAKWWE
ncbi:MAG: tetratricopeptide repeat protein, partial [bacterium]